MHNMLQRLIFVAEKTPDSPAIGSSKTTLSFSELLDTSLRFSKWLEAQGAKPGDLVALDLDPELECVFVFACYAAGVSSCRGVPDAELLLEIGVKFVIRQSSVDVQSKPVTLLVSESVMQEIGAYPDEELSPSPQTHDSGNIFFSSGTTGKPKSIFVSAEDLQIRERFVRAGRISGRYMALIGLGTFGGFMTMLSQIVNGKPYLVAGSVENNVSVIFGWNVEKIFASPPQLEALLNQSISSQRSLALEEVQSTGTGISAKLVRRIQGETGAKVKSVYASTEAGLVAIKSDGWEDPTYAGELIEGVEARVVDVFGAEVEEGQSGRVKISAPGQASSYLNDSDLGATNFPDGWFLPGDFGLLRGRSLFLLGRQSEILNAGGVKVDPSAIDQLAVEFDGVDDAASFAFLSDSEVQTTGLAFVSSNPPKPEILRLFIARKFGEAAPTYFFRVAQIPRNELGKPMRSALAARFESKRDKNA